MRGRRSRFPIAAVLLAGCAGLRPDPSSEPVREFLGAEALVTHAQSRDRVSAAGQLAEPAYLYVQVSPPNAEIRVDGVTRGSGWAFVTIPRSRLPVVRATAAGHLPIEGPIEVFERQVTKVRLELVRAGAVTALTDPAGATVLLDGRESGHTPVTIRGVTPGPHRLELRMGSWQWSTDVTVGPVGTQVVSQTIRDYMADPPPLPPDPGAGPPRTGAPLPPDCAAVCGRYADLFEGSASFREIVRDQCRARCGRGDLRFTTCAWRSRSPDEAAGCAAIPDEPGSSP